MQITKELLQKYNILEGDGEIFYMKGISKRMFGMWPLEDDNQWRYFYETPDESIHAASSIKTEDELITALKFSKIDMNTKDIEHKETSLNQFIELLVKFRDANPGSGECPVLIENIDAPGCLDAMSYFQPNGIERIVTFDGDICGVAVGAGEV